METRPEGLRNLGAVMSNFDAEIEPTAEEELKACDCYGGYPAMNFWAEVWFDGNFKAIVKQYCQHINTIESDSLRGIMNTASALYGNE